MTAKLLLDSHVPSEVATTVRKISDQIDIEHLSTWRGGAFLNAGDDLLLEVCFLEKRAIVSKDRKTLPGWIVARIAQGKGHGGVVFYDLERFRSDQIGALAAAIVKAVQKTNGDFFNRWITLR